MNFLGLFFFTVLFLVSKAMMEPTCLYSMGRNNEQYNIAGYSSFNKYITKIEFLLYEKVKDSFNFALQFNKTFPGIIMSHSTPERLVFIQLLHSLDVRDPVFNHLLLRVSQEFEITDSTKFQYWLDDSFDFPPIKILNMVNYLASEKIHLTRNLIEQMLYLSEKYKVFQNAVSLRDTKVIKWLLVNGLDITYVGGEIFEETWKNNQLDIVEIIMKNGKMENLNIRKEIVNKLYENNETLLHTAVRMGLKEAIDFLVGNLDLSVNSRDILGNLPIYYAVKANNSEIVEELVTLGSDVPEELFEHAVVKGYTQIVNFLLVSPQCVLSDNSVKNTLFLAVNSNHLDIVKSLISTTEGRSHLNSTDDFGNTLMHIASSKGFIDCVVLLNSFGVAHDSPNINGETPLYKAVENGNLEIIKELLVIGANINQKTESGNSLLHIAACKGYLDIAKLLIRNHIYVNEKNSIGQMPLYKAAQSGKVEMMDLLIREGADIYATNNGMTMLHEAAAVGNVNAVISLIKSGFGNIDIRGFWRVTPLHLAAGGGHIKCVELLLRKGSDPNAKNRDLWTPLHRAAVGGHDKIVEMLLEYSADPNLKTAEGYTPLVLAVDRRHLNVVAVLQRNQKIKRIRDVNEQKKVIMAQT